MLGASLVTTYWYVFLCGVIQADLSQLNESYTVAKIADFGLSRERGSGNAMTTAVGALAWMAPEAFLSKRSI